MTIPEFESLVKSFGMIFGALWVAYEFRRYRKRELDFKHDEIHGKLAIRVDSRFNLRASKEPALDCYRVVYDLEIINQSAGPIRLGHCTLECHLGHLEESWLGAPSNAIFPVNHPGEAIGIVQWTEAKPLSVQTSLSGRMLPPGGSSSIKYGFLIKADAISIVAVKCEVPIHQDNGEQAVYRRFLQWRPLWNTESELTSEDDSSFRGHG